MLQIKPEDIEKKSFEILTSQMDKDRLKFYTDDELLVVKELSIPRLTLTISTMLFFKTMQLKL